MTILFAAQVAFFIQLVHSLEEMLTGFHKKWFFVPMPFWVFFTFEMILFLISLLVIFTNIFPFKEVFLKFYLLLMFANGVEHTVWLMWKKKYVPGLLTSLLHLVWSSYYFLTT